MLMKKFKFKGRELVECLKRMTLKTVKAGDILMNDSQVMEGFFIIINGRCSRHHSIMSAMHKAFKGRLLTIQPLTQILDGPS